MKAAPPAWTGAGRRMLSMALVAMLILNTKAPVTSAYERSDISAIAAASVVLENVVAFEIARAFLEKFGGDSMVQLEASHRTWVDLARRLPLEG